MKAPRLVVLLLLAALAVPSTAVAQRDGFLAAFVQFYQALRGAYGDEGPQLAAQLEKMTTALAAWDREIRDAESQLQPRLKGADVQTALEVHTILASLYLDRSRFDDALREFEADISIDPTRAAFHRYKGLIYQATARQADAADAFRAAWRLDPADPQNAYRLIVYRSDSATAREIEQVGFAPPFFYVYCYDLMCVFADDCESNCEIERCDQDEAGALLLSCFL